MILRNVMIQQKYIMRKRIILLVHNFINIFYYCLTIISSIIVKLLTRDGSCAYRDRLLQEHCIFDIRCH